MADKVTEKSGPHMQDLVSLFLFSKGSNYVLVRPTLFRNIMTFGGAVYTKKLDTLQTVGVQLGAIVSPSDGT